MNLKILPGGASLPGSQGRRKADGLASSRIKATAKPIDMQWRTPFLDDYFACVSPKPSHVFLMLRIRVFLERLSIAFGTGRQDLLSNKGEDDEAASLLAKQLTEKEGSAVKQLSCERCGHARTPRPAYMRLDPWRKRGGPAGIGNFTMAWTPTRTATIWGYPSPAEKPLS